MTSIIKVDTLQKANGATPTAADLGINTTGTVLQVKQNIYDTAAAISASYVGGNGYSMNGWVFTGVSLAFTPTSSSSRIILNSTINFATTNHGERISFKIVRDTGSINPVTGMGAIDGSRRMCHSSSLYFNYGSDEHTDEISMYTYDEPSTTNTVTYKVYVNQNSSSAATIFINRPDNNGNAFYIPKTISTLTGFEVAQ
jgi:hypothetical protein